LSKSHGWTYVLLGGMAPSKKKLTSIKPNF